jgi:1,4-dihydroxy-6-naphthoate synthase
MTRVTVGHSPDADDAFMFYALAHGKISVEGVPSGGYSEVHADIQALNRRAFAGDLDMTQVSAGAYPYVADAYRITSCGCSMGFNYGPIVVAQDAETDFRGAPVAIPGEHTTAYLLGRIFLPPFQPVEMAFADVLPAVRDGSVTAGIVIHEGQLSYADHGLIKQVDLGERWFAASGLPLPLGLNVVRRGLGEARQRALASALSASIAWADAHPEPALAYARSFAPEVDAELTAEFTRMYVNDLTRDMGSQGAAGLEALYRRATDGGLLDNVPLLDILRV